MVQQPQHINPILVCAVNLWGEGCLHHACLITGTGRWPEFAQSPYTVRYIPVPHHGFPCMISYTMLTCTTGISCPAALPPSAVFLRWAAAEAI